MIRRRRPRAQLLLAAVLATPSFIAGGSSRAAAVVPEGTQPLDIFAGAALLEDPGGRLAIADVAWGPAGARFRPTRPGDADAGISASAFWLRFDLGAVPATGRWFLRLYQTVEDAQLYIDRGTGPRLLQRLGKRHPFGLRVIASKDIYVPLEAGPPARFYLRLESRDTLRLHAHLVLAEEIVARVAAEERAAGLYLGAIGALWVFNLVIFLWLRDRAYGYYLIFQASLALLQAALDQVTFRFLWPDAPRWAAWSESFFLGWAYFGAAGFARAFLRESPAAPRLTGDRIIHVAQYLSLTLVLGAPLTTLPLGSAVALVQSIVTALLLWTFGFLALRRGGPNARFFVAGWTLLLAMVVLQNLTALRLLPSVQFTDHAVRLGAVVEGVLFSLALAYRINRLRRENARIQAEMMRQRLAALVNLASGVVHEIGNPLNFIKGGVEDLRRRARQITDHLTPRGDSPLAQDPGMAEARRAAGPLLEGAELVARGTERITRIIENLRGRITDAPRPLESVDLERVVTDTVALARDRLAAGQVEVALDLPSLPPVRGLAVEIGQVLMNLLVNAAEAMPAGGTVRVSGAASGETVSISVCDTGPGVPEEIRAAIFDPFFTTRPRGTGLGLFISQEIALRLGGELSLVESGPGATFRLTLARADAIT